ncbi:MAG: spore photoproduct lyase [Vulcanibacillus sp.]
MKEGLFNPKYVFFESRALDYPLGRELYKKFKESNTMVMMTTSHNQVRGIPGETEIEKYRNAKKTLVIGVRKTLKFEQSLPSAEYALPLSTGCMGECQYCYLQTTMGSKPYIRIYVNLEEILDATKAYIEEREPDLTRFEAACTSDPVSLEHIHGALKRTIEFMANQANGRLRFVTKYTNVEPFLNIKHNKHTYFRFSINADYVIKNFEANTSSFFDRILAASKIAKAGYPLGFIIAPLMIFDNWKEGYSELLSKLKANIPEDIHDEIYFELITHRFTKAAKKIILQRYPKTKLEMDEEKRKVKWGKYGKFKYIYPDDEYSELKNYMYHEINSFFPKAKIEYFT